MKNFIPFLFVLIFVPQVMESQISGMWHSSCCEGPITDFSMSLKGKVKSWTMTKQNGDTRTMTYDQEGLKQSDTFSGTVQTYVPPDYMLIKLKNEFEKIHPREAKLDRNKKFNERGQLTEYKIFDNYFEKNTFDNQGRIVIHQKTTSRQETRYWNSAHHASPTYTYTINTGVLVFYRYNDQGYLYEIEYFNSDPFKNVKKVFIYDENNNIIEDNRYDHYNISVGNMPDDYLSDIMEDDIDEFFDITEYYDNYWSQGSPSVCKWNYNDLGQKIEYLVFGYRKGLSFKAVWEYNDEGFLTKEIQYDIYRDRISVVLDFDKKGNVIREKRVGYDTLEDHISVIKIDYYE